MSDLYEELAIELGLSEEDRNEGLSSGKQLKYKNRIGWARTYLKKAGLLESRSRGEIQITPRGLQILANPPDRLDAKYLKRFPEFAAFQTYKPSKTSDTNSEGDSDSSATPEEALEQAHQTLKENTTQELLERVKAADPSSFES
jgi:restriction system protein